MRRPHGPGRGCALGHPRAARASGCGCPADWGLRTPSLKPDPCEFELLALPHSRSRSECGVTPSGKGLPCPGGCTETPDAVGTDGVGSRSCGRPDEVTCAGESSSGGHRAGVGWGRPERPCHRPRRKDIPGSACDRHQGASLEGLRLEFWALSVCLLGRRGCEGGRVYPEGGERRPVGHPSVCGLPSPPRGQLGAAEPGRPRDCVQGWVAGGAGTGDPKNCWAAVALSCGSPRCSLPRPRLVAQWALSCLSHLWAL